MSTFTSGEQGCDNFQEQDSGYPIPGNRHQCYGPYPHIPGEERCGRVVSFCINCNRDHHEGGWETCKPARASEPSDAA